MEENGGKDIGCCRAIGAALLHAPSHMHEQAGRKGADNDSLQLFCHHEFDRWAARTMELTGRMDARQCAAEWERRNIDRSVNRSKDQLLQNQASSD
jgi:hypothetical protein